MKRFYMFYFIFSIIFALIVSITLILNTAIETLEKEKEKLVLENQNLERYFKEAKKLENILKTIKLKIYEKNIANDIILTFLENLRKKYDLQIRNVSEKKGLIEAEIKININLSKENLKKLLLVLTKSTSPIVYIEEFILTDKEKFIKIKVYQPYLEL